MSNKIFKFKENNHFPSYMNYIFFNHMVNKEIEKKLFKYSAKQQRVFGRANKTMPISKIIILKEK